MRSYFEVLQTPQEDRSMFMGTNTEPAVRSFIELQAVTAGYESIDLTEWLKVTPVRTIEDLLIAQYQDKYAALKARLKLEALKGQKWRTSMQALEQHLIGLFTTPNLGWTDVSCMDVVMGMAPEGYVSQLGLKDHTTWRELLTDVVNLEAKDLARRAKAPAAGRTSRRKRYESSNQLVVHEHREAEDQSYADGLSLDDDLEPDSDMGCSTSSIESDINEEETVLKEAQLHLNLEKSEFGRDSVIYLGHRLSANGLEPEATKVEVIRKWPQLANVRGFRSFLGLASYYPKFVPKFYVIAHPPSRLTSKNVAYAWCEKCETAFQALKEALVSHHVLRIADPNLTFVATMDASQNGIGAVLQQDDGDGLRPLEYYSKRMPSHKVATSTYMCELYAFREALTHWKHYLLGRHFKVYSDHRTLQWIKTQIDLSPILTRWLHDIDVYNFELKHKKGCYNRVADALSRHLDLRRKLKKDLVEHTAKDPDLSPILKQLKADPSSQPDFHECEGLVFRRYGKFDRLCVPNHAPLRTHFLDLAHGRSGHFDFEKTYESLLQQFDWPRMKGSAEKFIAECQVCQRTKVHRHKPYGLLKPLPIPDGPGESVSIDFTDMGKTPGARRQNEREDPRMSSHGVMEMMVT
ncbi:hypothetical protein CBR_g66645 [Chara braunii]|uniref:Reverse transcriptase/retrotransposon-derived protein RNase H-like domain-containing protein n=1 Tax=Chara braunii TaxID=69332 RepID=A0A388JQ53_CHABU|nr:hypothetical protein CBR_g66645 [Chara braunii]|eukprot:GBG59842.1 hypothetical protein CBR_g66645 [Chara braunii]